MRMFMLRYALLCLYKNLYYIAIVHGRVNSP